jgi:hypothetical protein
MDRGQISRIDYPTNPTHDLSGRQLFDVSPNVREAFDLAAKSLYAWSATGGDEPTVVVHGSPTLISNIAALAKDHKEMMPADLYWRMVHHANCSPRRRLQASKLSHDGSYAIGAKCLLEWVQDKQVESKVYTPTADH